jgi:hypothetical protein
MSPNSFTLTTRTDCAGESATLASRARIQFTKKLPKERVYGATIWMRTRGNLDEKRRPWRIMVAPNPDRCKPLVTVPRAAIRSVMPFLFLARPDCIRLRLGRDVRWGAADMAP